MTKSDHEFINAETSYVFAAHIQGGKWSTEAFVKKQCESDLDEIFSLNSIVFL